MPQTVEFAFEFACVVANRVKACAGVPAAGVAGINICTQGVVFTEVARVRHALQGVVACGVFMSGLTQLGNYGVVDLRATTTFFGREVISSSKVDWDIDGVVGIVACCANVVAICAALPVLQRKLA